MDSRRTPDHPVPGVPRHTPDPTLERGFVASLRWLVAEGDARGVRRIAVELRALREALTTLDETRRARDEHAERAALLDREIQDAVRLLGDATKVDGNGSLVARLTRLRDILGRDLATRRNLVNERNAWRAMCELQTRTRAMVHALLEESEQSREKLESEVGTLRDRAALLASVQHETAAEAAGLRNRLSTLERQRDVAMDHARDASGELAALRQRLHQWSGTVDRALEELARASGALRMDSGRGGGDGL